MSSIPGNTTLSQASINQQFVVTLENRRKDIQDMVFKSHPVLEKILATLQAASGDGFRVPVKFRDLDVTGYSRSNGTGAHSTAESPKVIQSVVFNWPDMIMTPITLNHRDLEINKGDATRIVALLESYLKFGKNDHANFLSAALWDVAGWDALKDADGNPLAESERDKYNIIPIPVLISDSRTLGGVTPNNGSYKTWKSIHVEFDANDEGGKDILDTMKRATNLTYIACRERPNWWITGLDAYDAIYNRAKELNINMQNRSETQETAFNEFTFEGNTITLDPDAPTDAMFAINTQYFGGKHLNDELVKPFAPYTVPGQLNETHVFGTTLQLWVDRRNAHAYVTGNFVKAGADTTP